MAKLSKAKVIDLIKAAPMFSALSDQAVGDLLESCEIRDYRAGARVFGPSQKADRFFLVLAGQVKIFKLSAKGDEQILHLYGPGETFGEAAMWGRGNYPAWADVTSDATLLAVTLQVLRRSIRDNAELAMGMLAGLSAKLREFNQLIEQLSLKEVPARLAGLLLVESRRAGSWKFRLRQTKRQLAAQLGTIPETLSRALGKMKAAGLIDVSGSKITLLKIDALEELADGG